MTLMTADPLDIAKETGLTPCPLHTRCEEMFANVGLIGREDLAIRGSGVRMLAHEAKAQEPTVEPDYLSVLRRWRALRNA
jgi:hypothetical protein